MSDIKTVAEFERYQAERRTRWQKGAAVVDTSTSGARDHQREHQAHREVVEPGIALPCAPSADRNSRPDHGNGEQTGTNRDQQAEVDGSAPLTNLSFDVPVAQPARANKYGNEKTEGYDSRREAKRAFELRCEHMAGQISDLREKVVYILIPRQLNADGSVAERACTYTADFVYFRGGELVVEDVKGFPNDRWAIKRKLMRFVHGIAVREV